MRIMVVNCENHLETMDPARKAALAKYQEYKQLFYLMIEESAKEENKRNSETFNELNFLGYRVGEFYHSDELLEKGRRNFNVYH